MMFIRVFGIAARGTALIAVNGKGNYYDPPVQVSFSLSTPLQSLDSVVTKLLATLQGVTLDLAAPEEQQLVGQWGRELQNPHDVAISRCLSFCSCLSLSSSFAILLKMRLKI